MESSLFRGLQGSYFTLHLKSRKCKYLQEKKKACCCKRKSTTRGEEVSAEAGVGGREKERDGEEIQTDIQTSSKQTQQFPGVGEGDGSQEDPNLVEKLEA